VSGLKGRRQLEARFRAIRTVFVPVGQSWADSTAEYARTHVPVATGRTQRSIRARKASKRGAKVVGRYTINFIDAGQRDHVEVPKQRKVMRYGSEGGIRFAKRVHHPSVAPRRFKHAAALHGMQSIPWAKELIGLWNGAA
jgi:hypothetical protein